MKKLFITLIILKVSSSLAQIDTCIIDSSFAKANNTLATYIAINYLKAHPSDPYYDSLTPPPYLVNQILKTYSRIYSSKSFERDSVISLYQIMGYFPDYVYTSFTLEVDTNYLWVKNYLKDSVTSGNSTFDSLVRNNGFKIRNYDGMGRIFVFTSKLLNLHPGKYFNALLSIPGITYVFQTPAIGDGDAIYYDYTATYHELIFGLGWGDCPSGCTENRYWKFYVYNDCSVAFISSYGDKPPVPTSPYTPFPTDSAYWRTDFLGISNAIGCTGESDDYQYIMKGDTIINSLMYKKIYKSGKRYPATSPPPCMNYLNYYKYYYGALRDDVSNRKVYFISNTSEELLYDFNLNVNDSLPPLPGSAQKYSVIDSIDFITLTDGKLHKRFRITNSGFGNVNDNYIIEGVGSLINLLSPLNKFEQVSHLVCFGSINKSPIYNDGVSLCTLIAPPVWPGDANSDKVSNNMDLLSLGMAWSDSGPIRAGATINWQAENCADWTNSFPDGINHKHADCDGNGAVGFSDTTAILKNYGLVHNQKLAQHQNVLGNVTLALALPPGNYKKGDRVNIPVTLGTLALPADSVYGVAYTIEYPAGVVDTNSVTVNFYKSWMGTYGIDLAGISKNIPKLNQVDVAVTRTDHKNISGFGTVCEIGITIDNLSGITKKMQNPYLYFIISNARLIDRYGKIIPLNLQGDSIQVNPNGVRQLNSDNTISIYPNPSNQIVYISSQSKINSVELFDLTGRLISARVEKQNNQVMLDVSMLDKGLYTIAIKSAEGVVYKKLQVN